MSHTTNCNGVNCVHIQRFHHANASAFVPATCNFHSVSKVSIKRFIVVSHMLVMPIVFTIVTAE